MPKCWCRLISEYNLNNNYSIMKFLFSIPLAWAWFCAAFFLHGCKSNSWSGRTQKLKTITLQLETAALRSSGSSEERSRLCKQADGKVWNKLKILICVITDNLLKRNIDGFEPNFIVFWPKCFFFIRSSPRQSIRQLIRPTHGTRRVWNT